MLVYFEYIDSLLFVHLLLQALTPPSEEERKGRDERGVSEEADFALATTHDRSFEKEDITSYVNHKREMFLVQYALGVKREEIRKLEDIAMVIIVCIEYMQDLNSAPTASV